MSHTFEGIYYETTAAYESAVRESQLRQAQAEANTLRAQANSQRQRLRSIEVELEKTQDDVVRQHRLQAELLGHMTDLRRTQTMLQQAQAQHAEDVQQAFTAVTAELEAGLAEADRRQKESAVALSQAIAQVNAKFVADQTARERQAQGDANRAEALATYAEELMKAIQPRVEHLKLQESFNRGRSRIDVVRRELAAPDGNRIVALNAAIEACESARDSENEAERRTAELAVVSGRLRDSVARLREMMAEPKVKSLISEFFAVESREAAVKLDDLGRREKTNYDRYAELEIHRDKDEKDLAKLEKEIMAMVAAAPVVAEWHQQRKQRMGEIVKALQGGLGPTKVSSHKYHVEGDAKSPLVITLNSGGAVVDLYLPLQPEEPFQIDGHDHQTNSQCEAEAVRVARALAVRVLNSGTQQLDGYARSGPRIQPRVAPTPWVGMAKRLKEIGV